MNIPVRKRVVFTILLTFIVVSECLPARTRKAGRHSSHNSAAGSHHKASHRKVTTTKKDSVNQQIIAAVMRPGKLDMSDERDLDQFQDFNKAFINNEMAAETSLLANQGIDDDSALRISNMAALPNGLPARHTASKTKINNIKGDVVPIAKPYVAGFSPDEYLLDANSWPEYRIKDSDYSSRNYRVYPQGQPGGNYQAGMQGGGMPYGQRVADGMEGPYGDGNYGFPAPPQMVSDEPNHPPTQIDDGPQPTITPASGRIQKLVMMHHRKLKDSQSFGDEAMNSTQAGSGSGSGADGSASGFLSHLGIASHLVPVSQGKLISDGKTTTKEESGQVTVDTKPEEPSSKAPDSAQGKTSGDTPSLPGQSTPQENVVKVSSPESTAPDQTQQTNEKSSNKASDNQDSKQQSNASNQGSDASNQGSSNASKQQSNASNQESNASNQGSDASNQGSNASKQESNASNQDSHASNQESNSSKQDSHASNQGSNASSQGSNASNQESNASNQESNASKEDSKSDSKPQDSKTQQKPTNKASASHNSPLGEFAKFLKEKGITLSINKDSPSRTDSAAKEPAPAQRDEKSSSDMKPQSSEVLPPNGQLSTVEGNNAARQEASLTNAVMKWQNISPQASAMGGLFLRHDTKQAHH